MSRAIRLALGQPYTRKKLKRLPRSSKPSMAAQRDYFVGVYVAAVVLEADIETGPTNLIGIPLIDRSAQQSLF